MSVQPRATMKRELQEVQDNLMRLGKMVDGAIARGLQSLAERAASWAKAVIDGDGEVNKLRFRIEEDCLALIATQQPAAGDLRAIVAAKNIVGGLGRMGDPPAGVSPI